MSSPFLNLEYIFGTFYNIITFGAGDGIDSIRNLFYAILPWFLGISFVFSAFCFIALIIIVRKMKALRAQAKAKKLAADPGYLDEEDVEVSDQPSAVRITKEGVSRWEKIQTQVNSNNPGDWRLAVLEADILLDEMMSKMGYRGTSLGEKLKSVERSDFASIDKAWEAHKVRNRIAHQGGDYILTQRDARIAIDLFGQVFEEFEYI